MKIMILGASGIIGQHMRLCVPEGVEPIWCRYRPDPYHESINLTDVLLLEEFLNKHRPDVIINLAGQNDVDAVQREPQQSIALNCLVPGRLAEWCDRNEAWLLHVSTQGVFGGGRPLYSAETEPYLEIAVNEYSTQKRIGENNLYAYRNWTIARPTFVVGVRPLPAQGRENPVEAWLSGRQPRQVDDRFFSIAFAGDAAEELWDLVQKGPQRRAFHIGMPGATSRWALMAALCTEEGKRRCTPLYASHDDFPGIAPRPGNLAWDDDALHDICFPDGIKQILGQWEAREKGGTWQRARELALFFGITEAEAFAKLNQGFHVLHAEVAEDFRRANPQTDEALLAWYRSTEATCWELSAYHCDELKGLRFNYSGMVGGIATHLASANKQLVLCLGDGIGDLTIACERAGLTPVYHDLEGSKTAEFARFRLWAHLGKTFKGYSYLTKGWKPDWVKRTGLFNPFDAVVSLDFLEHVPNVEEWVRAVYESLAPGGLFLAQNAFAIGDNEHGGSIPMHLTRNNHYEQDWDPLLDRIGFVREGGNWRRKP